MQKSGEVPYLKETVAIFQKYLNGEKNHVFTLNDALFFYTCGRQDEIAHWLSHGEDLED